MEITSLSDSEDELIAERLQKSNGRLFLHYSFKAIGSSISNLEVDHEWLGIAFIFDRLSRFDKDITYVREDGITFSLVVKTEDWELFIKEVMNLREWDDFGTFSNIDIAFVDFADSIDLYRLRTPDFAENYFANYVCCGIHEEASQYEKPEVHLKKKYKKHPEWRYGLWQCHKQGIADGEVLYSQFCWVIDSSKRDHVFETIYGYKPTFRLCLQKDDILFTERAACRLSDIRNISEAKTWITSQEDSAGPVKYYLSDNGDILLMDYGSLTIVYFDFSSVSGEKLLDIYHAEQDAISTLAKLVRDRAAISYQWKSLNDDTFQSLCQKLLCRISRFRDARIEPVGKTRSRDGGRDFLIYTTERPGLHATKYIVQCKYKEDNGSLTRSKMGDIGTTIAQYDADGYIVMTNGILDATLIDSLEGLSNNQRFRTDIGSQYTRTQLEHHLDLNPDIAKEFHLI